MNVYKGLIFPLLRGVEPERAHGLTLRLLAVAQDSAVGWILLRMVAGRIPQRPLTVFGLRFGNELGVAAGYDKDGLAPRGLALLGFGHVEVGTVTPWAQVGNARPRIFRVPEERALINRMGFPNGGMARVTARLRQLREQGAAGSGDFVLGVSLGKQKETPLAEAADDYVAVMRAVYPYADYLAVNVSSPNTPGLRKLQGRGYLEELLRALQGENTKLAAGGQRRPLLLKIAPDLSWAEIDQVLEAAQAAEVAGIIATNTTLERRGPAVGRMEEAGGLSGVPLAQRSREVVAYVSGQMGARMPVVAVGGIMSADDARASLEAGARLVQVYTGLVYEGPRLPGRILRGLEAAPNWRCQNGGAKPAAS